ncbi:MAG: FAD:protein FMN transferase [Duodenibacillus sp.]|nr:FAD:protein FMN transferase [Duodenibacillus sp.]
MGTLVQLQVDAADKAAADRLIEGFEAGLKRYEALFTANAVNTEGEGAPAAEGLSRINAQAGDWVEADCELAGAVAYAKRLAQASGGAFEPTIGPLVKLWKIGFEGARKPSDAEVAAARALVDWRRIEVEQSPGACRVRIGRGQKLDLGALAKGWAGTRLIDALRAGGAESAMADLGGNVALLGRSPAGRAWRIGVQRPDAERGVALAAIELEDASLVTSGNYERNFQKDGVTYGHILDAATGMPAVTDMGSVSIVDADGAKADGWCTALFAMGVERAVALAARTPGLQVFIVDAAVKNAWVSKALAPRVLMLDDSVALRVIEPAPQGPGAPVSNH